MIRLVLSLLCFVLFPSVAGSQVLQVFPRTIDLRVSASGLDQVVSTEDFLQIRIDTRLLQGSRWQLSIQLVTPPESFGKTFRPEVLSWTARPPFISRNLLPNQKVIIGEGPINGRVFEGRLIWRAGDGALSAGDYRGRIMLILEEIP
jgi:hypothetical protein